MEQLGYIKGRGIWYKSELRTIRKKGDSPLQPLFEAFTNSLEAIWSLKRDKKSASRGSISINIHFTKTLPLYADNSYDFKKISITDTGVGLNDSEFERLINLRDDRKNFNNKGTGRIQFLHSFKKTVIKSTFIDNNSSTGFTERTVTLSKSEAFLKNNAIIRLDSEKEIEAISSGTTVTFETILNTKDKEFYGNIQSDEIKNDLIRHYLAGFCENRDSLPQIQIATYIDEEGENLDEIVSADIPTPKKEKPIVIYYSKVDSNTIEKISKKECFNLKAFVIDKDELSENGLKLISKGEVAKDIKLDNLLPTDQINGRRYLFLLSGDYIDNRDSDTRGEINIITEKELKKRARENSLFSTEEILIEDIENITNQTIVSLFGEIEKKREEKEKNIQDLQEMFLLNDNILESLKNKINIGDSDEYILKKVYEADMKIVAKKDAEIRKKIKELGKLDISKDDYQDKLTKQVDDFVKIIPLQNKAALTQYVARRKLVLELFEKVLDKELNNLKSQGRIDEKLLHNLIFQQSSDNPKLSDLWLIEEDFIYFKGFSERKLNKIELNGKPIFNKKFSDEEQKYLHSLGENRLIKRPDVLLFPDEGKCLIIEFKAPDVNVSEYLNQMNFYANLIRNYTVESVQITAFYGYLIGENIEDRDVRGHVSSFEHSYHLDYWFQPSQKVIGFDSRPDGSIYTEVIKFTTLLQRAKNRNKIFISKLEDTH